MIQLDFGDHRPLYEQICDKIKELIIRGVLLEGDKIPSVRELAQSLAINPNTIQKAYKELEKEGYIYSQKAKGNFVSPRGDNTNTEKSAELFDAIIPVIRELRFLGISKSEISSMIEKIYKEDSNDKS